MGQLFGGQNVVVIPDLIGNPEKFIHWLTDWIPAFAGMTALKSTISSL